LVSSESGSDESGSVVLSSPSAASYSVIFSGSYIIQDFLLLAEPLTIACKGIGFEYIDENNDSNDNSVNFYSMLPCQQTY